MPRSTRLPSRKGSVVQHGQKTRETKRRALTRARLVQQVPHTEYEARPLLPTVHARPATANSSFKAICSSNTVTSLFAIITIAVCLLTLSQLGFAGIFPTLNTAQQVTAPSPGPLDFESIHTDFLGAQNVKVDNIVETDSGGFHDDDQVTQDKLDKEIRGKGSKSSSHKNDDGDNTKVRTQIKPSQRNGDKSDKSNGNRDNDEHKVKHNNQKDDIGARSNNDGVNNPEVNPDNAESVSLQRSQADGLRDMDHLAAAFIHDVLASTIEHVFIVNPSLPTGFGRAATSISILLDVIASEELAQKATLVTCENAVLSECTEVKSVALGAKENSRAQRSITFYLGAGVSYGCHKQLALQPDVKQPFLYVAMVLNPLHEILALHTTEPTPSVCTNVDETCFLLRFLPHDIIQGAQTLATTEELIVSTFVVFPLSWPQRSILMLLRLLRFLQPHDDISKTSKQHLSLLDSTKSIRSIFGQALADNHVSVDDLKVLQQSVQVHEEAYQFMVNLAVFQEQTASLPPGGLHGNAIDLSAASSSCDVQLLRNQLRARIAPGVKHVLFVHYPKTAGTTLRVALKVFAEKHGIPLHSCYSKNKGKSGGECELQVDPAIPSASMSFEIHYGHSVKWGFHETLPPNEPFVYIVMTRDPLARRISDFIFQKEKRHDAFEDKVKQHKLAPTLQQHLLNCQSQAPMFTGLLNFVFDSRFADISSPLSAAWRNKVCSIAEHFVVVSTEQFDDSLTLLSNIFYWMASQQENAADKITPRNNRMSNVMGHDAQEEEDRVISLGAIALGEQCLRDAYVGYNFLSSLERSQRAWLS